MTKNHKTISDKIHDRLNEANLLRLQKRFDEALTVYQDCIQKYGKNVEILAMIAFVKFCRAFEDPNETGETYHIVIAELKDALALEPNNFKLHAYLAEVYSLGTLNYELAAEEYRYAIELNPANAFILFGAASLYGLPDEVISLDEAIQWMEEAIMLSPDNPDYYVRLGYLYKDASRMTDAQQIWIQSLLCSTPLEAEYAESVIHEIRNLAV
ncbi:MAG: hypothetical protein AAF639_42955 [Chloroflexota bacterium]